MKNGIIMYTQGTVAKYKSVKFDDYEICYDKKKIPYIKCLGSSKTEIVSIDDSKLLFPLVDLEYEYADQFYECFEKTYAICFEKHLKESYNVTTDMLALDKNGEDILNDARDSFNKVDIIDNGTLSEAILHDSNIHSFVLQPFIPLFEKYGVPVALLDAKKNIVRYWPLFKKVEDLFIFCEKLEILNDIHETIEISDAKVGLKKDEENKLMLINYFECPFEYVKYNLLFSKMIGTLKIENCKFCGSTMIVRRAGKKYCSDSCRARDSRKNRKEKGN